jgi:hypothetical protein
LRGAHPSNAAVNILAIAERDQLKAVRFDIEDVNHPTISNPKFESRYALQAFVMKKPKLCSEQIDFRFDLSLYTCRQPEKTVIKLR